MMQQPGAGAGMAPLQHQQQQPYLQQQPPYPQQQPQPYPQQQPQQPHPYMMMAPQQQQHQQYQQPTWAPQPNQTVAGGPDEVRTLWIGDLQYWMDENYIGSCIPPTSEVVNMKVIRNKQTGHLEGYGFVEFASHAAAEKFLQTYNGTPMPNGEQNFRLNWASYSGGEKRDDSPEYTIFVGDLAADVTDYMLQETFRAHYQSVKGAKVVLDRITQRTKGYGFVRFGDESEQLRAMTEMNGRLCSTRPMRIGIATNKKSSVAPKASEQSSHYQSDHDPANTTIFVGNLDSNVTDDQLRELFGRCGQLLHVKIPAGKRCGFVQFADRSCAEEALRVLDGAQLGGQNIRLSWGRSPSNKQPHQENQWNGGYYGGYGQGYTQGYGQGYENYGYAAAPQDPNMYYGAYAGYGGYQQQPPQQQQPQQPQQPQVGYS